MKVLNLAALVSTLLAPTAVVAGGATATVQLANTMSGHWQNFIVPEDGQPRSLHMLQREYPNKPPLERASSSQFNEFQQNSACCISQYEPHIQAMLDSRKTWTWLAGGDVVELSNVYITCWTT